MSILLACCSATALLQVLGADTTGCYVDVCSQGNVTLTLYNRTNCQCAIFDGLGFVIMSELAGNEVTHVLWGEASVDATDTYYDTLDMDGDGLNELLTGFASENTFWGYMHRFAIDSLNIVNITTVQVPDSLCSRFDFDGVIERRDSSLFVQGFWGDHNGYLVISFDRKSKQFVFELRQ